MNIYQRDYKTLVHEIKEPKIEELIHVAAAAAAATAKSLQSCPTL